MTRTSVGSAVLQAACVLCCAGVFAGAVERTYDTSEEMLFMDFGSFVTTASKYEEPSSEAGSVVRVITEDEIRRFGFRTVGEILKTIAGFEVININRKEYLATRGVREASLVLIDGVSVVNPDDNEISLDEVIPLSIIKRIEILKTPGGVTWGTDALLGVINIITKDGLPGNATGSVTTSAGSWERYQNVISYSRKLEKGSFFFNFDFLETNDFPIKVDNYLKNEDPGPGVIPSYWAGPGESEDHKPDYFYNVFSKLKYNDFIITLMKGDKEEYYQFTESGNLLGQGEDGLESDPIKTLVSIEHNKGVYEDLKLKTRVSLMERGLNINIAYFGASDILADGDFYRYSTESGEMLITQKYNILQEITYLGLDNAAFLAGIDFGFVHSPDIWGIPGQLGAAAPELAAKGYNRYTRSFYLKTDIKPVSGVKLSAGGRYDASNEVKNSFINSLSLVVNPLDNSYVKLLYQEGFRQPDAEQLYSFSGSKNLKPEKSHAVDLAVGSSINKVVNWEIDAASVRLDDLVEEIPGAIFGVDDFFRNSGTTDIQSLEASVSASLSRFRGFTTYGMKTRKDNDVESKFNAERQFTAALNYEILAKALQSSVVYRYYSERTTDFYAPNSLVRTTQTLDPVSLFDAGIIVTRTWNDNPVLKNIEFSVFVYNVLDETYYSTGREGRTRVPIPQEPRSIVAKLTYQF